MKARLLPPNMRAKIVLELCQVGGFDFCWTWTGCVNSRGYACVGVDGKSQLAHRVSYELLVGPITAGLQIDHLCRNTRCINPAHLEPVTARVNASRTDQATKSHCAHGHPFTVENTIWRKRGHLAHRACRECQIAHQRDYRRRSKASA